MKKRVLFINSAGDGGADTWLHLLLLRHLDRDLHTLHVAGQVADDRREIASSAIRAMEGVVRRPTDFGPSISGHGTARLRAIGRFARAAPSLAGLVRHIKRERIEILHSTDRPRDAIACAVLADLTGAKSVIHVHVKFGSWMSRGVRWAFGRADALLGVSRFVAGSLVDAGYDARRVHPVLNAVDLPAWNPALDGTACRRALGVPEGAPLIVSVARLFRWKGHAALIEAFAAAKKQAPEARLAIVGEDDPTGRGTTDSLRALAKERGVLGHVLFTGHRKDIGHLMAASDVFALPSFEEPFGLVFAEAMAMKRPVIALANGGTPEVVEHGVTGLLAPPGDIGRLTENLVTLLSDAGLRARMGEAGRRRVEAHFTAPRLARDVEGIYSQLVGMSR